MSDIKVIADKDEIVAIADAVRSKTGSSEKMDGLVGIANAVNEIGAGGGESLETCTVQLSSGSEVVALSYNALVDGKMVAKAITNPEDGYDFTITDIVKGSVLSVWSEDYSGSYIEIVYGDAEQLYSDLYVRNYCYVINGDCEIHFSYD